MSAAPSAAQSRHAYGPSALGESFGRFWSLTVMLARTEFKLRFFGSALGYLWTLINPLMLFGVLLFVFTVVIEINRGNSVHHYAEYLLQGIIIFTYFSETTGASVTSLVARENLLRKVRFPRLVIPLSVALTCFFNLCLNLVVVFIFILVSGISPRWSWLELPLLLIPLVALTTGVGMLLSALYVRFRDIQPIWSVVLQLLYYSTPILYTIETAADHRLLGLSFARLLAINPLGAILTQLRKAMLEPGAPSAVDAIGGAVYLLIPAGIVVGVFVLGWWYFNHSAPLIAEKL